MTAQEMIYELTELISKHGDKEVFVDGYGVVDIDYNVADDCLDIQA